MKLLSLVVGALVGVASAFPHISPEMLSSTAKVSVMEYSRQKRQIIQPPFDAKAQYVSNTGDHAFIAPGPNDARGPCPGLNAAANHGYLPRNGAVSITQFITGTYEVFGMAADLAGFLAVYGSIFDGNGLGWSIGGPTDKIPPLLGLLGNPTGISGSHNKYEGDASPIRGDLYTYGNSYENVVSQFEEFFSRQDGVPDDKANFDLDVITAHRAARFQNSIETNPYFFNAPFSGIIASPAAYSFIYRFMANKSAEYPEGRLDRETLKAFYAMEGEPGNFTYKPGWERIPDNWYRRNDLDLYTIPYYAVDALAQVLAHLEFASLGGNTGTVNSFVGLDPGNLTGSVYTVDTLFQANNLVCFGFQAATQQTPDLIEGLLTGQTLASSPLGNLVANITSVLDCPKLSNLQYDQFKRFPGYAKDYDGYKAPQH